MSFHRLLETRVIRGRLREADSLIDYRGPFVPWFEPMEAPAQSAWIAAMRTLEAGGDKRAA